MVNAFVLTCTFTTVNFYKRPLVNEVEQNKLLVCSSTEEYAEYLNSCAHAYPAKPHDVNSLFQLMGVV